MWSHANLRGLGGTPGMSLAGSCVPNPTADNPEQVICGGITFHNVRDALAWPVVVIVRIMPTVTNTLAANPMPVSFPLFGMEPGITGPVAATPAQAQAYGLPLTPVTLVSPLPSITSPAVDKVSSDVINPICSINQLVTGYPLLAALAAVGLFIAFQRGGRR